MKSHFNSSLSFGFNSYWSSKYSFSFIGYRIEISFVYQECILHMLQSYLKHNRNFSSIKTDDVDYINHVTYKQ